MVAPASTQSDNANPNAIVGAKHACRGEGRSRADIERPSCIEDNSKSPLMGSIPFHADQPAAGPIAQCAGAVALAGLDSVTGSSAGRAGVPSAFT